MTRMSAARARELDSVLALVCDRTNLNFSGARLIKYTNNAVWEIPGRSPVVVRIGIGDLGVSRAARVVPLARWLATHGAPVPPLLEVEQPIVVDGYAATIWKWLPGAGERFTGADLADALRRFHSLDAAANAELPRWDPFAAARRRLEAADPALLNEDRVWLDEQWRLAERSYREAEVDVGVIHGDAHTGNLLRDHRGQPVLCDLDSAGIGPLAWDLVVCAVGAERFGRGDSYADLARAYGRDVTTEPAWPVLRRIRELGLVTSVVPDLARPTVAAEHRRRLTSLRTGHPSGPWQRYR